MNLTGKAIKLLFKYICMLAFLMIISGIVFGQKLDDKPNILILLADDMGYGDVGVYGSKKIPTPNIDKLADEGIYFTDAHSPGATCTPTRYALLTGRYYWRSEMDVKGGYGYATPRIESGLVTLPEFLKKHGYHTAAVGKWHLGLQWGLKENADWAGQNGENIDYSKPITNGPLQHGFEYYFGLPGSLDMPPYVFVENNKTVGIPSEEKKPKNTLQWNRGGLMTPGWKDENVGPTLTEKAISFIRSHVKEQSENPFFLYFAASAPHTPAVPPDFIKGKSQAGARGDMVAEFDWSVGQIIQLLEDLGIRKNTLVIVSSDNGALTTGPSWWTGEPLEKYDIDHRGHEPNGVLRGQKADIWEGGHRVPFIVNWPHGISTRGVNREVVSLIDLYSTFAAIIEKKVPSKAGDSYNILPTLLGQHLEERIALIHRAPRTGLMAIRKGSWKLIDGRGSGGFTQPVEWVIQEGEPEGQLYNLDTDMSETTNLWLSHPQRVNELKELLEQYKKRNK